MILRALTLLFLAVLPLWVAAQERVPVGALQDMLERAEPGAHLILAPGRHDGPVLLDRPVTLEGESGASIVGNGQGSVITVTAPDVILRGLAISGSGQDGAAIDSGIRLLKGAERALVEGNHLTGNLHGIDIHGARDAVVRGNTVIGSDFHRVNDRGNGIYVWNAPGAVVIGNDIRLGRDGIFSNASRRNVFRDNIFRDLRFAIHFMYTNDTEISGNISIGNTLGYALMFSDRITVRGNLSLGDRTHGLMLNYANSADVTGNLVRGGTHEKCTFIYNAHKNLIAGNRFEGCEIGIHFTAGSERNAITGNAFVGNRTQVKYVGTRDVEWSLDGRGNYWSDHPAFDLDGDGLADGAFRPNDLMDHILWSQPAAKLLLGAPVVQLLRWSQAAFPAVLPGGVVDSHPLMAPVEIPVPEALLPEEARAVAQARNRRRDDADALASH
ncbi:MAG: nitrous oxide reductase family maturation protein NosD [Roseovarius sp.]|nr:nitrous oxide reductase family maturation protein NosD [Roseovarius sp.]